ncbi:glycosyltransferase family 25 protein [Thalassobius sp. I31.1]|uniref:glycosyltransferase family 25 protein n=1 Tax=Thalassobius sp. I31.1 TaxID=2109912 RepID=UPI001300A38A|nr:glycosyltransferase family 25 protein [Thalassobius sp. I31.1]
MTVPAWYINLDRHTDRRAYMERHIQELDIAIDRFPAFDANRLSDAEVSIWKDDTSNLTKGEMCCFLSHRSIWEKIAMGEADYGAIFEDDVLLSPEIKEFLETIDWIPENVGLIRLETTFQSVTVGRPLAELFNHRELHSLLTLHWGAAGYVVSKEIAVRMLQKSQKISLPADWFKFDPAFGFKPTQIVPALCVQQQFYHETFLPSTANESSLEQARHNRARETRPKGIALINREIMRIPKQIRRFILSSYFGVRRIRVDFR